MRNIDELHLEQPFMGARMLRDQLNREGFDVGRKHVSTLMKRMGLEVLYKKPNTSKKYENSRESTLKSKNTVQTKGPLHNLPESTDEHHLF